MATKEWSRNMETNGEPIQKSLKWFEIWKIAFLHPTVKAYTQINADPNASTKRGVFWALLAALTAWLIGPQRFFLGGFVADNFGLRSLTNFYVIGAVVYPILSILILILGVAIAHSFARLFNGKGTFPRLIYSWAVIQLPFLLVIGIVNRLPSLFLSSHTDYMSTSGLILQVASLLLSAGILLYLSYAEVVAFSAVEGFGIGKGLGILLLLSLIAGSVGACLSIVFQALTQNFYRYY